MESSLRVESLSSPPPIVIEFDHTVDEAIRAGCAVGRDRLRTFVIAYVLIGLGLLLVGSVDLDTGQFDFRPPFLAMGVMLLTAPLWRPILHRRSIRRQHARLATANKPVRWTIAARGLEVKSAVGEARMDWSAIIRAREDRDGFVLYTHPRIGHWLPKHGFKTEADVAQLRALIERCGIRLSR